MLVSLLLLLPLLSLALLFLPLLFLLLFLLFFLFLFLKLDSIMNFDFQKMNLYSQRVSYSSLLGEGNGTPLQYSCLENPRDGGA